MLVVRFGKVQRHDTFSVDHGRVPLHQRVPTLLACSNEPRQPIARAGYDHVRFVDPNALGLTKCLRHCT